LLNLAPIALREIHTVGFALSPYLIQTWTLTMLGFLMKGTPQDMRAVVIGEADPYSMTKCLDIGLFSEIMLALRAPTTSKCDMCSVSFCGINVQGRCVAAPLLAQQPHGLGDIGDLIECSFIYDCFDGNNVEVEIMLDYLTAQRLTPKHIYREVNHNPRCAYTYKPYFL
jgi:hypothetical protein